LGAAPARVQGNVSTATAPRPTTTIATTPNPTDAIAAGVVANAVTSAATPRSAPIEEKTTTGLSPERVSVPVLEDPLAEPTPTEMIVTSPFSRGTGTARHGRREPMARPAAAPRMR